MSIRRNCLCLMLCLCVLGGVLTVVSPLPRVQASAAVNPFADEVDSLNILKLWAKDWNPTKTLDVKQYASLLEKLFNGRKTPPLVKPTGTNLPTTNVTYKDALLVAGGLLGFTKEESYDRMKALTPELKKVDTASINGYDVAYIFSCLLGATRVGQTTTLLEERYLVGKNPTVISRVMQLNSSKIILEDEGTMALAADVQVFAVDGEHISPVGLSDVASGMTGLKLLFNDKKQVQTIMVNGRYAPKTMRILLSQEFNALGSSKSYDFSQIQVTATQPFKIVVREKGEDQIVMVAETNEIITFTNQNGSIKVVSGNFSRVVKNRIYLKSYLWHNISFDPLITTQRNGKVPIYAGTLEIAPSNKAGTLYLINELPIEMYLRKVVAAQVPTAWGKEVAVVQAIAARSYAIAEISQGKFSDRGANLDDSNSTQLYNNSPENPAINEAIDETEGIVATYNGHVIDAVFFSSSAGFTANSEEVWHNDQTRTFPGVPVPYLRSQSLIHQGIVPFIDGETSALAFFRNNSYKSFDAAAPFFRWKVELTGEELANTISKGLIEREKNDIAMNTNFVIPIQGPAIDLNNLGFSVGKLKDLRVNLRGEGGSIMVMDIVSSKGIWRVKKEFNIRNVLKPRKDYTGSEEDVLLYLNDGTVQKNYPLLPSAFAAFDITKDDAGYIEKVTIYGGGNGHGVGLSQWGVKGMVEMGYTTEQIFTRFYKDVKLEKIY